MRHFLSLHPLCLHPASRCAAVTAVTVEVARRREGELVLRYRVTGAVPQLVLPPPAPSVRTDDLWRSTCFEAFIQASDGPVYYEFNFAPSTRWAAYTFSGYRADMRPLSDISTPRIETHATSDLYELDAAVRLPAFDAPFFHAPWRLGLSAVLEETNGDKSYWALAHPPGKADFHHAAGFALELPVPEQT